MELSEIVDGLYELAPEDFTATRDAAVKELRKEGRREEAERVKAVRRPTAAAGAVNRLVRAHRHEVEGFLRAAGTLRDAQVAGKGDVVSAARRQRDLLDQLVELGGGDVRATLQAAAVDDDVARDLLDARLEREPEPPGFGTLLAHAAPETETRQPAAHTQPKVEPQAKKATGSPRSKKPDDRHARARLREAKEQRDAAAADERQARQRWTRSQRELEKMEAAVERAQRDLERVRGR